MSFWSAEKVSELKRLWKEGKSGVQIAISLGASSRAVILGKIHQLKLSKRGGVIVRKIRHAPRSPSPNLPKRKSTSSFVSVLPIERSVQLAPKESSLLPLIETSENVCKFIFDDTNTCCGKPTRLKSKWCDEHHALCVVKPRRWP